MGENNKMIRVGFICNNASKNWMGGVNYLKNLLYSISVLKNRVIEPVVFVGKKTDIEIKTIFRQYSTVIEHPMFDRNNFQWFAGKIFSKFFHSSFMLESLLKKYDIAVLSHSNATGLKSCKIINWIPDFQHLHLPQMFPKEEIIRRDKYFMKFAKGSDIIVLSSNDALKDFNNFAPFYANKARILQFVSQPDEIYFKLTEKDELSFRAKYDLNEPFFYLPNQLWVHKNHIVVFQAIKILKKRNSNLTLICTGHINDPRNKTHFEELKNFIERNKLEKNIKLLGLVDYKDVFNFIKFSKAVINPSLFEGLSLTVQECKSVGKNMILSDLDVHKEQYPTAVFFDRYNAGHLADIMEKMVINDDYKKDNNSTEIAKNNLWSRTQSFGENYQNLILALTDNSIRGK